MGRAHALLAVLLLKVQGTQRLHAQGCSVPGLITYWRDVPRLYRSQLAAQRVRSQIEA